MEGSKSYSSGDKITEVWEPESAKISLSDISVIKAQALDSAEAVASKTDVLKPASDSPVGASPRVRDLRAQYFTTKLSRNNSEASTESSIKPSERDVKEDGDI